MAMGIAAMLAATALMAQAATPAATAATETPAADSPAAAKAEKPKKVCVEEEQMGSHFKRRICATPEEWEKRRERDAANMARPRGNTPNPN